MSLQISSSHRSQHCAVNYGIYRLDNPCLSDFYPDDLPVDWRLEYYNNEFNLILLTLPELEAELQLKGHCAKDLCTGISDILEELHEKFILLIELTSGFYHSMSKADSEQLEKLCNSWANLHFVLDQDTAGWNKEAVNSGYSLSQWKNIINEDNNCCLVIEEKGKLTPPELKQLLDTCFQLSNSKNELWILFSSAEYGLENCRNAILMDSLM